MTDDVLADRMLERWRLHPAAMIREEFHTEPEPWQEEALEIFPHVERLGFKACKGPGKTALLAWLILNFLATRPHPRIGATSITGDNLDSNLWPELAKWMGQSTYLTATLTWTSTRVFSKRYPATWWAQKRTWPKKANAEEQSHALAGLHAPYVMGVLDESSEIPQAVMTTIEAVLGSCVEGKILQAGNPTRLDGPLYRACTVDKHLWTIITITGDPLDLKRSQRVKLEWAQQQIASYGRDNPWVMANVLGMFPPSSINALLGVEEVEAAMARHYKLTDYSWAQKRLGVDVARFGDDRTAIFPRQGIAAFKPVEMRVQRTTVIAARIAKAFNDWCRGDGLILIDDTGHWGHGAVDSLITAGYPCVPIIASDPAMDRRYKNRRVEMWLEGAKWIKAGGALPNLPGLVGELTTPTYSFLGSKFVLEDKDQIKERLGRSPDLADALMQTFALPDQPAELMTRQKSRQQTHQGGDFDPFGREPAHTGHAEIDFNPFLPRE